MSTQKQIETNQKNSLFSTGASTEEGKSIISKNAIKHGIFAKDLIISCGEGKENSEEYQELFDNLIRDLNPDGQLQWVLVEKIAVDFWRLKRVLRFETGSIRICSDMVNYDYYKQVDYNGEKVNRTNDEIELEIQEEKEEFDWNNRYISCLEKGLVSFDKPEWKGEGLEIDLEEDLGMVIGEIDPEARFLSFREMKKILATHGYTDKDVSSALIKCIKEQNEKIQKKMFDLEQHKLKNKLKEEVNIKLYSLPIGDNAEKVMRYERAIQHSILQNLSLLKRLQASIQ